MTALKIIWRFVLPLIPVLSLIVSANAFDLDGAWTPDAANCSKVFAKRNNQIEIKRNADAFGGGFVIDGSRIRGHFLTCKIDHRVEDGATVHLLASCTTTAAPLSPMQFSVRFEDYDEIKRIFDSFLESSISYFRCKF